jgi:hypothetical protein
MPTNVVKIGKKKCKPFLLEVMVFSPESGYRFEVLVEKGCTPDNDVIWKLVFDLFHRNNGEFDQIVHVSFTAGSSDEKEGIQNIAKDGISKPQARHVINNVFPAAKELEGVAQPTAAQKKKLHNEMNKAVTAIDV